MDFSPSAAAIARPGEASPSPFVRTRRLETFMSGLDLVVPRRAWLGSDH